MDFEFSSEQEQLRASVRRYLADRAPIVGYVREHYGTAVGADAVWRGLAALGVVGLLAPEEHGGAGMGLVDAAVVLEECGRAVYPGPYLASAIGAISLVDVIGNASDRAALLPALADGSQVATLAAFEPGRRTDWSTPATTATPSTTGDPRISGTKVHVLDAAVADLFLVVAAGPSGEIGAYACRRGPTVTVTDSPGIDGARTTGTVTFDDAPATRLGHDTGAAEAGITATLDRMSTALVVDAVGAAARALELAVDYAKTRIAFDRPIGSFQAVQHLCADMLRALELARAAGYYACWALDAAEPAEGRRAAMMAAAFAAEELPRLGATAIQVFGGVGFTWEHDIHLYYKRLVTAGALLGTADDHLAALADLVL